MLFASLISNFDSVEVAQIDLKINVELPKRGVVLQSFFSAFHFRVIFVSALEQHLLHDSQSIVVELLFDEKFSPSPPNREAVIIHFEVDLGGLEKHLVAPSELFLAL